MRTAQLFDELASTLLSALLICSPLSAQNQTAVPAQTQAEGQAPDAKRAHKAAERGDKAEAEGRFEEALTAYDEAARYAPKDPAIVGHAAALRAKLVSNHVELAERHALDGNIVKATEEISKALHIDPGNTFLAERLAEMKSMEEEPSTKSNAQIEGMPKLKPQNIKQTLDLRGDTKTVYEQLALMFGVKASFDPELTSRSVRLRLTDVDFDTAASVLGRQTATFWCPVSTDLFFVAADTTEKRRRYALQAEQTFLLPGSAAPDEMTELLRVLRDITGATHIVLNASAHTITMRDTPDKLALAGELIRDAEKAHGEVMLEIELLEVDQNKARDLGILPPSSSSLVLLSKQDISKLQSSTDIGNLLTNLQQVLSGKGFSSVPNFTLVGGGLSTFLLTLPGAAANFSDSLSLVRSGRDIFLRAQDGKPATFFVGERFPVTLSLLSASIGNGGTLSGTPGATTFPETQFTVGNQPSAIVADNFTGGGLPDLAVANQADNTITILKNQDGGNFIAANNSPFALTNNQTTAETGPVALASSLLVHPVSNGSTTTPTKDLIVANSTSNNVAILYGSVDVNGNFAFTEAAGSPYAVGKGPSAVVVADFNNDGIPDFAVANKTDGTVSVFEGKNDGTFTEFPGSPVRLATGAAPVAMVTGHFNGTVNVNEIDLAVVNQGTNSVSILLSSIDNNQNVTFQEATNSPISVGQFPVAIAQADFNLDVVPDLAVVNQADGTISILLGSTNQDGTFTNALGSPFATATVGNSKPAGIAVSNFTGGSTLDLAVTNQNLGTLSVFVGQGNGTFLQGPELNTPAGPGAVIASALATTNGGLPDAALTAQASGASQGLVAVILDSPGFATGGSNAGQVPYPGSEFIDLGVKIKATPTLHGNNEVTLQLEFEIKALSGQNVNGIPVISNRTLSQTVRVKEDEPTLLGGVTDHEETRSITGLPGFATLPVIGYALGTRSTSLQNTELLIVITPRKLRLPERKTHTIFAGHDQSIVGFGGVDRGFDRGIRPE